MSEYEIQYTTADPECPIVWEPLNAEEAVMLKRQYGGEAVFVAGGTLLRTQWEGGVTAPPAHMIRLDTIEGIRGVTDHEHEVVVGALTSLKECGTHPLIRAHADVLYNACQHIAAPSIRNLATIGGNIASAVGDAIPALLVHHARLIWADLDHISMHYEQDASDWIEEVRTGRRKLNAVLLGIAFSKSSSFLHNSRTDHSSSWIFSPNEVSTLSKQWREISFFRKLGRREAFTASIVTIAFQAWLGPEGQLLKVKIAAGGGSGLAMRLSNCEQSIDGEIYHPSLLSQLAEQAAKEFISYSDPFASEQYRKQAVGNLLAAGLWEVLHTKA